jgi:hypothetical protein
LLPPPLPRTEGDDRASGTLMTMGEFYGFRAPGRELVKAPGDDYFYHQRIVRKYMVYNDKLLLIHDAGVGKTRSAMGFLMEILDAPLKKIYRRIYIVAPTTLHDEWKNTPEYTVLKDKVSISLITYLDLSAMKPDQNPGSIFVVDEVHKFSNEDVMRRVGEIDFNNPPSLVNTARTNSTLPIYKGIWNMTNNTPLSKTILLTATPMRNSSEDFYPVVNLIVPLAEQMWDRGNLPDDEGLKNVLTGRVSYVRAADEGIQIEYGLSPEMLTGICISQFFSGVGEVTLARIYSPEVGREYPLPPLLSDFPLSHLKLEVGGTGEYVILDLGRREFITQEDGSIECSIRDNLVTFTKIPQGDLLITAPTLMNNRMRVGGVNPVEVPVVESMLTPYHSHLFVRKQAEPNVNPLQGQGPAVFNSYLLLSSLGSSEITPGELMHLSSLYYTTINIFLRSLPMESREPIHPNWREHVLDESVETGKNIFYYEFTESRGGIEDLARVLEMVGYERFENRDNLKAFDTLPKKARFILNPTERDRALFNHQDNWDGSFIQISLYSERGATGVNYLDVRHIHRIPHWTPSENTQSLYRGIRAKSHENIRQHVPDLKIRVYSHVTTPNPAIINYNNTWATEGISLEGVTYKAPDDIPNDPLNPGFGEMVDGAHPLSAAVGFDRLYSTIPVGPGSGGVQLTIQGFVLGHLPNPTVHPNMTLTDLKLPEREGFSPELAITFYSPTSYRYWTAVSKDISMSRIKRLYKISAMDCNLNRGRNVLSSDFDNSEACDYTTCEYECLPDERGLEIVIDTVDPGTGEDVRQNPWSPLTLPRLATWEVYGSLTPHAKNEYVNFLVDIFSQAYRNFLSVFTVLKLTRERFRGDREVTEHQALGILSEIVYGQHAQNRFRDGFDNPCVLKNQGNILYLCPLYDSERKLRLQPKSETLARFLHGPGIHLYSNKISLRRVVETPKSVDTLKQIYIDFRDRSEAGGRDLLETCFGLAASDFDLFVSVVEGAFLWRLVNGISNPVIERFGKYFSNVDTEVRLQTINRLYIGGEGKLYRKEQIEQVVPAVSAWGEELLTQNPRVHFHFLHHLHPSLADVRKLLSENARCKILVEGLEDTGFMYTTISEQKTLYELHNQNIVAQVNTLSQREGVPGGYVGIFDERGYIQPEDREKLEYFKVFKYSPASKKDPQGQVCMSMTTAVFDTIAQSYGIERAGVKMDKCKRLYEKMKGDGFLW